MQGVTYVTRADYLSPFFNELGYCLAVERLLGIEAPARAQVIRVLFCEMNRISSHLVWLATGGLELGAVSVMLYGFREREVLLDIFEAITGLRMNHAYIRIGGVIMDMPEEGVRKIREFLARCPGGSTSTSRCSHENPIWLERNRGVGRAFGRRRARRWASPARCCGRPASPTDLRKDTPYSGYETYDFDVRPHRRRRLRALRDPPGRDAAVDAHHRTVPRPARGAGPGDGRGPEGRAGRRSSRSVPTASATPRHMSATSWRSRWRR